MALQLEPRNDGKLLLVTLSGKLTKEDYAHFVPETERWIRQNGRIRVLFDMHDFQGWDAGAMWEDLKFGLRHFRDIERLAMVGEKRWQKGMSVFCRPFTTAEIRYFDRGEEDAARRWIGLDDAAAHVAAANVPNATTPDESTPA